MIVLATVIGGLVRGFTGFGFAMVFMPPASVVLGPAAALGLILVVDAPFALLLGARAMRRAEWGEVLPLLLAATLIMPAGIWLLTGLDRQAMRWILAGLVLGAVALMGSGWRYQGRPGLPLSLGVGGLSGLFNGLAGLGGMPLAIFWLGAQRTDRHQARANLQAYFGLATLVSGVTFWLTGIVTQASFRLALPLLLVYGAGVAIGTHGFRLASETTFRRIAYAVIFLSAVVSLPAWDGVLGR